MAIKKSIRLINGLNVDAAYIRIDTVNGYKEEITMSVNSYLSQEHFLNGCEYLSQKLYSFKPSIEDGSENFIKQGYEHLKTLPEFTDAIDC